MCKRSDIRLQANTTVRSTGPLRLPDLQDRDQHRKQSGACGLSGQFPPSPPPPLRYTCSPSLWEGPWFRSVPPRSVPPQSAVPLPAHPPLPSKYLLPLPLGGPPVLEPPASISTASISCTASRPRLHKLSSSQKRKSAEGGGGLSGYCGAQASGRAAARWCGPGRRGGRMESRKGVSRGTGI